MDTARRIGGAALIYFCALFTALGLSQLVRELMVLSGLESILGQVAGSARAVSRARQGPAHRGAEEGGGVHHHDPRPARALRRLPAPVANVVHGPPTG